MNREKTKKVYELTQYVRARLDRHSWCRRQTQYDSEFISWLNKKLMEVCNAVYNLSQSECLFPKGGEDGLLTDETIENLLSDIARDKDIFKFFERCRRDEASSCLGDYLVWAIVVRHFAMIVADEASKAQKALCDAECEKKLKDYKSFVDYFLQLLGAFNNMLGLRAKDEDIIAMLDSELDKLGAKAEALKKEMGVKQ